jgi:molybdenum cofactor biosynthesis enzyme MoaA
MSDSSLRTCLGRDDEISLREALTNGKDALKQVIHQAILDKPRCHLFNQKVLEQRNMSRIGG